MIDQGIPYKSVCTPYMFRNPSPTSRAEPFFLKVYNKEELTLSARFRPPVQSTQSFPLIRPISHQTYNMKVISALLMVAAAAVASAAAYDDDGDNWVPPPGYKAYPEGRWCNHGTAGDKGCEAQGENSYCVRHHKHLKHTRNMCMLIHTTEEC